MTINIGDHLPEMTLRHLVDDKITEINTRDIFAGKKVVLFAVPGAFTPTCSVQHVPSFLDRIDEFLARGVDSIVCTAVNDPFIMKHWGDSMGASGKIQFLPDGNGEFARAIGLEMDVSAAGLGVRSKRYAMYVVDGVVQYLAVEKPGAFEVSSGEAILSHIS